ncbi:uroporphyrinogen decarboxylase [Desulfotalea psychrophila]|uniref:Uroporphyrinogen decarboxylase n=1 Tax=Desulfotalea psychrophila (strain LSv54 / DSM 12343) TaxID=177439 RepID=DCUP_DESPS|nr:uroporphyrinogen decarboxylase [Desulfotalea psychrophila]Q6ANR5.1 RecName: Full=Uroporphyrinogen decarboxylase; Short=UPD; Short=URO-D [Desulfotalea psychrophila LSv54]CAG36009.1 probable uroporphyrinogen decarboxylase [Desulfotalea psychrophila LSv54]
MNDTFLKACRGEKTDYTPIWMMRQAGRYLPAYQKIRGKVSFLELCKNPALCVEVTLQPVDLLGMDAAILFSDILILMEAMGAKLEFNEGCGPVFPNPIKDQTALDALIIPDADDATGFVMETIRLLRGELQVPLIGFAGAPFTCATYLIEGGSSKVFWETKKMMFTQPELFHGIMEKITQATILYLQAQARAGAQALQIFDSWAGVLAPCDFEVFALPYVRRIIASLQQFDLPIIYFANNGSTLLEMSASSGASVLGLDWRINIGDAGKRVPGIALQGNIDPFALLLPKDKLRKRIGTILEDAKEVKGHIFNLGHGIHQFTPPEQARIAVDAVHELSCK